MPTRIRARHQRRAFSRRRIGAPRVGCRCEPRRRRRRCDRRRNAPRGRSTGPVALNALSSQGRAVRDMAEGIESSSTVRPYRPWVGFGQRQMRRLGEQWPPASWIIGADCENTGRAYLEGVGGQARASTSVMPGERCRHDILALQPDVSRTEPARIGGDLLGQGIHRWRSGSSVVACLFTRQFERDFVRRDGPAIDRQDEAAAGSLAENPTPGLASKFLHGSCYPMAVLRHRPLVAGNGTPRRCAATAANAEPAQVVAMPAPMPRRDGHGRGRGRGRIIRPSTCWLFDFPRISSSSTATPATSSRARCLGSR